MRDAATANAAIAGHVCALDHLREWIAGEFGNALLDQFAECIFSPPVIGAGRFRFP